MWKLLLFVFFLYWHQGFPEVLIVNRVISYYKLDKESSYLNITNSYNFRTYNIWILSIWNVDPRALSFQLAWQFLFCLEKNEKKNQTNTSFLSRPVPGSNSGTMASIVDRLNSVITEWSREKLPLTGWSGKIVYRNKSIQKSLFMSSSMS